MAIVIVKSTLNDEGEIENQIVGQSPNIGNANRNASRIGATKGTEVGREYGSSQQPGMTRLYEGEAGGQVAVSNFEKNQYFGK